MDGPGREFPATRWSTICLAREPRSPGFREAADRLCSLYWKPVHVYICLVRGLPCEEAKDLTQEFFIELIGGEMLRRYQADRGSFRSYLRGAIRLFLLERKQAQFAAKRGGGRRILSLDGTVQVPSAEVPPDEAFEREWARSLLAQVLDELHGRLAHEGKEPYFQVFHRYEVAPSLSKEHSYASLAAEFDISEDDVSNYLRHCHELFRVIVVERIRDYVSGEQELDEELGHIFRLLGGPHS